MAELILTDSEKAAMNWFALDDAAVGKIVKKTILAMLKLSTEQDRVWWFSAALMMCTMAAERDCHLASFELNNVSLDERRFGDWKVTVERVKA